MNDQSRDWYAPRGRKWRRQVVALAASATTLLASAAICHARSQESAKESSPAGAEDLVQQALAAQLSGDSAKREELLAAAREAGDERLANWQSGLVYYQDQWRTPEAIAELAAADAALAEYRAQLAASDESLASHQALADWCADRKLLDEEKFHRTAILRLDPGDQLSRRRLGLREFDGLLLTNQRIKELRSEIATKSKAFEDYKDEFADWLREAAGADEAGRQDVLDRFAAVDDATAIPALYKSAVLDQTAHDRFIRKLGKEATTKFAKELGLAVVDAVSGMPERDATIFLMNTAVFCDDAELRTAARAALAGRRPTDYMPQMVGALQSLVEADIRVDVSPNGDVTYAAVYHEDGAESDRTHAETRAGITVLDEGGDRAAFLANVQRNYRTASVLAAQRSAAVAMENSQRSSLNGRVIEALAEISGDDLGEDPKAWRTKWAAVNDMYYPDERPQEYTQAQSMVDVTYIPAAPAALSPAQRQCECFAVGTLVWTKAGPQRIELLRAGDQVLSQHPLTGELTYKPVTAVTVRPQAKFVHMELPGGDRISATRGHRFWVDGEGWCMAQFLKPQLPLHAIGGSVKLAAATVEDGEEAYNLVVDEFHTYFVGETKLLVHDCTCPAATLSPIPGMKARRGPSTLAEGLQLTAK